MILLLTPGMGTWRVTYAMTDSGSWKVVIFGKKIMSWTLDTFVGTTNLSSQHSYIMEWVPPCFQKNQEENLPPFLPPPSEGSESESRSVMSDSL